MSGNNRAASGCMVLSRAGVGRNTGIPAGERTSAPSSGVLDVMNSPGLQPRLLRPHLSALIQQTHVPAAITAHAPQNTGITNRLSVPVGSSMTARRTCCSVPRPPVSSTVPTKAGPSFLISHTTGNQHACGTIPS